ncbi:MAG TPA: glucan 1,4-alpha-glucosidase [Geminicoccaceae bacterium]|nr:glucan 1,4-alpha-glucosidase [Geminicoccaceae bacterium]
MPKPFASYAAVVGLAALVVSGGGALAAGGAPGFPGAPSVWTYAGKTGVGTSYERYVGGRYEDGGPTGVVSKVWFSLADGIVTETAHGMIHEAQIKDLQLLVTGNAFFDEEKADTEHRIEYLHTDGSGRPLSLAYRVINTDRDGKYSIEKHVFTDPSRQSLFMRVVLTANDGHITPYLLVNPHMKNTGGGDVAYVGSGYLAARQDHDRYLSVRSTTPFVRTSAGFVGVSDGWQDLNADGAMDWDYAWADDGGGNVAMTAQLPTLNAGETATFDVAVGFGGSHAAAIAEADASLGAGYQAVLDEYNGAGGAVGWEDYLAGLSNLSGMVGMTADGGGLLHASALVLKALEDKENAGALIASLSVPWGDAKSADGFETGYRAVWPRDFYQCAMALLALGDTETPVVAFRYLDKVQVKPTTPGNTGATGWFLQKSHVNGALEWVGLQMDQTAMPIMLGWKLWKAGLLTDAEIDGRYATMLKPAAEFLANGGVVNILGGAYRVDPPWTRMERWEEQAGYSPSTTAAVITGLLVAADIARHASDPGAAAWYEMKADLFAANVERSMFTIMSPLTASPANGRHYVRITGDQDPNDGDDIAGSNGQPPLDERRVLDPGFLELVRYGVRAGNDPYVLDSLPEVDDTSLPESLRVRYDLPCDGGAYPGWRRYGNDGYGERTDSGSAYEGGHPAQRGRVWPFLTGERGQFELERVKAGGGGTISAAQLDQLKDTYVKAMECFANEGLMLPEQVWDGVGNNSTYGFVTGEGTNSATPLAWAHAEYVKLVKSLADGNTWDSYPIVRDRYAAPHQKTFVQVFLRGTGNGWGVTAMRLVGDHSWRIEGVPFGGAPDERFKFDLYGDWSHNYGDNEGDGAADYFGADIGITGGGGSYTITFNDDTKAYTVAKE